LQGLQEAVLKKLIPARGRKHRQLYALHCIFGDFMDIMSDWTKTTTKKGIVIERQEYTIRGNTYRVDGKRVVTTLSQKEKAVADFICNSLGKKVELVPKINYPPGIQTPDYLIDGERFDLKSPTGKGKYLLQGLIAKKKQQSHNFIIDVTNCPLDFEELKRQTESLFKSPRTAFLEKIVFLKGNEIIGAYKKEKTVHRTNQPQKRDMGFENGL